VIWLNVEGVGNATNGIKLNSINTSKMKDNNSVNQEWISVKERLPEKPGWYEVKTKSGKTAKIPFASILSGKQMRWAVLIETEIAYWRTTPTEPKPDSLT
jgi:hypothetical protein